MAGPPTVLLPLTLPALLTYVLSTQADTAATRLIVCSSQASFLHDFHRALQHQHGQTGDELQQAIAPTLHNLFTAGHVTVAFCASVQALLAYLTAYGGATAKRGVTNEKDAQERIVLVNPLSLHALTPSFSAQGLSRTFAAAVETALRTNAVLEMAECIGASLNDGLDGGNDTDAIMGDTEGSQRADSHDDPWEQDVAILNVSARRFGSGSNDRAWVGRTVKAKRIAARWFHFHKLNASLGLDITG
ncbi:hypothetical protein BDV95DRAFT_489211 [Massariosphaeria phaeospora]|uniref:Uncharacterized protein n=1 Tax=Massariosphaeria phaeospora TaxID=100035 RepID=A0A7C8MSF1_9PLEO|nr:hypothetical protein BDV95DRAFT_489211 [Massariosphaeria phaeospora]